MKKFMTAAAAAALLVSCEIEDDLEIRADGSGTYQARITVERIVRPVLGRIRDDAERQGFRIIKEGVTFTSRYIVIRKDFEAVRELSGPQSNFDLKIEQSWFRRRYRLYGSIAAVPNASFERRFTITMPAKVTSTSAGGFEGRRVTWYCANGGKIDVVAEGFHIPFEPRFLLGALGVLGTAAVMAGTIMLLMRRRTATGANNIEPMSTCTTCLKPMPAAARYCPGCGDRVLAPPPQRPSGMP